MFREYSPQRPLLHETNQLREKITVLAPFHLKALLNCFTYYSLPIGRPQPGQKMLPIKTQARSATILPNFVGLKFQVHNGKIYNDVTITEDMVGHKLGEFSA